MARRNKEVNDLSGTVKLMTDDDYRNRFRAEYYQLKIRLEHLNAMLDEYRKGTLGYEPDCPFDVLYR